MPPYRGAGGRGSGSGAGAGAGPGAQGSLSLHVNKQDTHLRDCLGEIAKGTDDVALGVGLAENRYIL